MKKTIRLIALLTIILALAVPAYAGDRTLFNDGVPSYDAPTATAHEIGVFYLKAIAADGRTVLWEEAAHNVLGNDGQQDFLSVYLRNSTNPSAFYIGLTDSTTPCSIAKADNLATVTGYGEPSGNGYARILVENSATGWTGLALDSGDYMATSKTVTFTASGGSIGPVYCAFLTDASSGTSGKHISFAALSTGRTLATGESLQVTYKIKLQ